jgi:hypothetical protein
MGLNLVFKELIDNKYNNIQQMHTIAIYNL